MKQIKKLSSQTFRTNRYKYRLLSNIEYVLFNKYKNILDLFYCCYIKRIKSKYYFIRKINFIVPIPLSKLVNDILKETFIIEPHNYVKHKNNIYIYDEEDILDIYFFIIVFNKNINFMKNKIPSDTVSTKLIVSLINQNNLTEVNILKFLKELNIQNYKLK